MNETRVTSINLGRLALTFVPVKSHRTSCSRYSCALRGVGVLRWNWRRHGGHKWGLGR